MSLPNSDDGLRLAQEIRCGGRKIKCTIRESARDALINGRWDAIGELREGVPAVQARTKQLPYLAAMRRPLRFRSWIAQRFSPSRPSAERGRSASRCGRIHRGDRRSCRSMFGARRYAGAARPWWQRGSLMSSQGALLHGGEAGDCGFPDGRVCGHRTAWRPSSRSALERSSPAIMRHGTCFGGTHRLAAWAAISRRACWMLLLPSVSGS